MAKGRDGKAAGYIQKTEQQLGNQVSYNKTLLEVREILENLGVPGFKQLKEDFGGDWKQGIHHLWLRRKAKEDEEKAERRSESRGDEAHS
jgi:hypothetical protein